MCRQIFCPAKLPLTFSLNLTDLPPNSSVMMDDWTQTTTSHESVPQTLMRQKHRWSLWGVPLWCRVLYHVVDPQAPPWSYFDSTNCCQLLIRTLKWTITYHQLLWIWVSTKKCAFEHEHWTVWTVFIEQAKVRGAIEREHTARRSKLPDEKLTQGRRWRSPTLQTDRQYQCKLCIVTFLMHP